MEKVPLRHNEVENLQTDAQQKNSKPELRTRRISSLCLSTNSSAYA